MFTIIIEKELRSILSGPKFAVTFAVCTILILLSVFLGIREYRATVKSFRAANQLTAQEMEETRSWMTFSTRVYREPEPMQVFVSGLHNDIGRFSNIHSTETIKLTNSIYADDPIFAVFRFIDFSVIVQIILSLFAVMFTYDVINGEREAGTLKLAFSNAIPRFQYILAKFLGSWLGLVLPILIPILLSLLFVIIFKVPFSGDDWAKLMMLMGVSLLYFTFFIVLGILFSALTKRSAISFLLLLVVWVIFVLIVPRVGVMAAGKIIPVSSVAEIDGQIDGYSKSRWDKFIKEMEERYRKRNADMEGMAEEEKEAYRDDHLWAWMEEEDAARRAVQIDIDNFSRLLLEDLRNRKAVQERLAFTLSRFSPASAYQLTAMNLAETDIYVKSRYETSLEQYKNTVVEYALKKQKESGQRGGIRVTVSSDEGMKLDLGKGDGTLDTSDMPRFKEIKQSFAEVITTSIIDFALLVFYCIAALVGAFAAFLRYDVR